MWCRIKFNAPSWRRISVLSYGTAKVSLRLAMAFAVSSAMTLGAWAEIPAAPLSKSYFFASQSACVASGVFSRQECRAAFINAQAEWRDRAPRFSSGVECRLRFALCDFRQGEKGYTPVALGVEMSLTRRGPFAAPTLAVETPATLFPKMPVTRDYASLRDFDASEDTHRSDDKSDILPSDRFEPFSKRGRIKASFSFNYASLGEVDSDKHGGSEETPEQRRARLRAAPFVY